MICSRGNRFGLFHLYVYGNVSEWCQDSYAPFRSRLGAITSERNWIQSENTDGQRILWGKSFRAPTIDVRSAERTTVTDAARILGAGFRVARTLG